MHSARAPPNGPPARRRGAGRGAWRPGSPAGGSTALGAASSCARGRELEPAADQTHVMTRTRAITTSWPLLLLVEPGSVGCPGEYAADDDDAGASLAAPNLATNVGTVDSGD